MKHIRDSIRTAFQAAPGIAPLTSSNSGGSTPILSQLFNPETLTLAQFFNTLFKTAIVVGAMLAVLRLGYAGFIYLTSDLPGKKGNAKDIISNAILGLLLLLSVWLILRQINPQILNLNILQNVENTRTDAAGRVLGPI